MNRKIGYLCRILWSFMRVCLMRAVSFNHIRCAMIELFSPTADISVSSKGSVTVGKRCNLEKNTQLRASGGKITLGNGVYINRNSNIVSHKEIKLGDHVTIGPNVNIYDHDHNYKNKGTADAYISKNIVIESGVWIGANCIITKGVTIGADSVIAAGTIVTKSVPPKTLLRADISYVMTHIGE